MRDEQLRLAVIIGSIREGRIGTTVAKWFIGQAQRRQDLEIQVIDLAEAPVPITQQSRPVPEGVYDSPRVRRLAAQIGSVDAIVVVTPEYNHGYPGPLKLAIDSINPEWHAKPIGFVSYGGISGGLRAIEQLRLVFAELHAITVRNTVSFHSVHARFDATGNPKDPNAVNAAATALLDQLTWWALVLRDARAAHPYPA